MTTFDFLFRTKTDSRRKAATIRSRSQRPLRVESLESRLLMAGNLTNNLQAAFSSAQSLEVPAIYQTAIAGATTSTDLQNLLVDGGHATVAIGTYFKADVSVKLNGPRGTIATFSNVQMNLGQFATSFLNTAVKNLQNFTEPLQPLASALTQPLLPGWGFSTTWLMQQLGYGDQVAAIKTFATTVQTINALPSSLSASDAWIHLGSFTAKVQSSMQLTTLTTSLVSAASVASQLSGNIATALQRLEAISGLHVAIEDPNALIRLITGETTTLFSYTFSVPKAIDVLKQQQLATIPVSPETLTEFDIYADLGVSVSGSATFGFDTSAFRSGNVADGFFVQNASLKANLTAGISGLLNEADLAGYELTGAVTGSITASLQGAGSQGKVYLDQANGAGIVFSSPNLTFGLTSKLLGPTQMLGLAVQEYGTYLKKLVGTDYQVAANILSGKGVSATDIAVALGTIYGIPPQTTTGILNKLGATGNDIASGLKAAYDADATQITGYMRTAGISLGNIAGALKQAGFPAPTSAVRLPASSANRTNRWRRSSPASASTPPTLPRT